MRTLALIAGLLMLTAGPTLAQDIAEADPDTAGDPLGAESGDAPPDLTGTWVLNEKLSDSFAPPADAGERGGGRGGGMGGGRGGGMGGGRGGGPGGMGGKGGGEPPSDEDMEQRRAEMQKRMEATKEKVARITIFQEGLEFNVTDGQDISHLLFTDGREMTIWTDRGQATASAAWDGPVLVTRWRTQEGQPEHMRRFTLDPETGRLTVTEIFAKPGSGQSVNRTMVYDRDR